MLENILGALGVTLNGIAVVVFATAFEFAAFPTVLMFAVGGIGMILTGQVSPLMVQTELIVLAGSLGKNRDERLSICVFAGIITTILGISGTIGRIVDFVGENILYGVMSGVGIILTKVALDMAQEEKRLGSISLVAGVLTYLLSEDIIYTTVASITIPSIVYNFEKRRKNKDTFSLEENSSDNSSDNEKFILTKLSFSPSMIRGIFAITTLLLGGIISETTINAALANVSVNYNAIATYAGIGSILSPLFGGIPSGIIVSGTAGAPNPILSGVLLMIFMGIIMVARLTPLLKKIFPMQGVVGILFVLGIFIIFPGNAQVALEGVPVIGGITIVITALADPFIGMLAGVLMKYLILC